MKRLAPITAVVLALLAALLWVSRDPGTPGPLLEGEPGAQPQQSVPGSISALDAARAPASGLESSSWGPAGADLAQEAPALGADGPTLDVLLLDESLDVPLIGDIEDSSGRWLAATTPAGEARLPWVKNGLGTLTFRAVGFRDTVATPTELDLTERLVVRMRPTSTARLETVDRKGAAIGGATVRIIPRERLAESFFHTPQAILDTSWSQTLVTDAAGAVAFALSGRAVAEIEAPSGARAQAWVQPGVTTVVTLDREPASLFVVDAETGQPLANFLATIEETGQPTVRPAPVQTDENGRIAIPSRASGVVLRLNDPRRKSTTWEPHPAVTAQGGGMILRFDHVEPGEEFTLRVKTCSVALRLVDARSGLPLKGVVTVTRESAHKQKESGETHWHESTVLRTTVRLNEGHLHLGCIYLTSSPTFRTRLHLEGYRDLTLLDPELVQNAEPRTLEMEPAVRPLAVTILREDGLPAVGKFTVRDHGTGASSPPAQADASGTIQLYDWSGEDLTVRHYLGRPGNTQRRDAGTIQASSVSANRATLILPGPDGRGALIVEGVPEWAPPVLALDMEGHLHRSFRQGPRTIIPRLPVGEYLVGTRDWLDGVYSQTPLAAEALAPVRSTVTRGSETTRQWDAAWAAEKALGGLVNAPPALLRTLTLIPWYATTRGAIQSSYERRLFLDQNGRYLIPKGAAVPARLLVCPASDLYWIDVLQSFLPGADVEIPAGRLTVEWEGALPAGDNLTVFVKATSPVLDAPFELTNDVGYYRHWTGAAPITFDAVSTFVDHIKVDAKGYERARFPVEVNPQIDARLKISLEDFMPKGD